MDGNRMRRAAAAVLAVVAAACSSTSPTQDQRLEASVTSTSAVQLDDLTPGASTTAVSGAPSPNRTARSNSRAAPPIEVSVGNRKLTNSHGIVDGQLQIGIPWIDTAAGKAALASIGGGGATLGDSRRQAQGVVDHINRTGGVAGLKLNPIFYEINVASSTNAAGRAREAQAACAAWEEDNEAFAFLVVLAPDDGHLACAQKTNSPAISSAAITTLTVDEETFAQMPNLLYNPSGLLADQRERAMVSQMVAEGVLTSKSKVGIMTDGNVAASKRVVQRTLRPELAKRKIEVVHEIAISDCLDAPYSSYVLQMRRAGVTDVYMAAGNCGAAPVLFFGRAADSQGWYPHILVGSDEAPGGMPGTQSRRVVEQIYGVGWQPRYDTAYSDGADVSPTDALCGEIMEGIGEPQDDAFDMANSYCDALLFLQAALRGSTTITPDGLAAGAAALRDTWQSVWTPRTNFAGGHLYGANAIRPLAFSADCECMRYTGPAVSPQ